MDTKSALFSAFIEYGVPVLVTGLFLMIKWALFQWSKKLASENQDNKATRFLEKVDALAITVTTDLEQTLKPTLIAATKDGVLTKDDYDKLKAAGIAGLKTYLGTDADKDVHDLLGIVETDKFLCASIEKAVNAIPSAQDPKKV